MSTGAVRFDPISFLDENSLCNYLPLFSFGVIGLYKCIGEFSLLRLASAVKRHPPKYFQPNFTPKR
jgi:hypothetical protein